PESRAGRDSSSPGSHDRPPECSSWESLADFDDALLEQLLEEKVPAKDEVYRQIAKDLENDLIVPVLLGSALDDNGITRLWKTLRHDGPTADATATRLGIPEAGALAATVVKTLHQSHTGKLSIARLWRGTIDDGQSFDGDRLSGLFHLHGTNPQKVTQANAGELVALGRMESLKTGQLLDENGPVEGAELIWPETPKPVYALALTPQNRQDEVKLTASLAKLIEEDASLALEHNADTHQMLLWGQGEIQLQLAVERLKSKYNVAVETGRPLTAYKETIRRGIKQHSRFKRQSGGHGQFADVQIEIKPLQRGRGFEFVNNIVGGAIPKNYIPAVDHGCQDYLSRGPLGFPVVDVQVTLFDGQFHSVDSSDQAFKTAGRMALSEGMPQCDPVLLEPIFEVVISVPNEYTAKIHGLVSGRRGQILGFEAREGWPGWDRLRCYLPQSEVQDLIVELRSLTSGLGTFEWRFDHLQELTGRLADKVIEARQSTAAE
ncbi:MAG: elongation factor G, partial [Kiloniellales bacterium]